MKLLSCVQFFATPWTVTYQAPPSMGFPRQEYWSALPFPSPGDLPDPRIKPWSPTLQADALPSEPQGKPYSHIYIHIYVCVCVCINIHKIWERRAKCGLVFWMQGSITHWLIRVLFVVKIVKAHWVPFDIKCFVSKCLFEEWLRLSFTINVICSNRFYTVVHFNIRISYWETVTTMVKKISM